MLPLLCVLSLHKPALMVTTVDHGQSFNQCFFIGLCQPIYGANPP
jgi:hypothetical protein